MMSSKNPQSSTTTMIQTQASLLAYVLHILKLNGFLQIKAIILPKKHFWLKSVKIWLSLQD